MPEFSKQLESRMHDLELQGLKSRIMKTKTKEVLSADELDKWIKTIRINKANLEWISETGEINGSLLVELRRVIPLINESYHQSKLNEVTDEMIEIQFKDVVVMPKNNFQGTYNLNMPYNKHKREGAKWLRDYLKKN